MFCCHWRRRAGLVPRKGATGRLPGSGVAKRGCSDVVVDASAHPRVAEGAWITACQCGISCRSKLRRWDGRFFIVTGAHGIGCGSGFTLQATDVGGSGGSGSAVMGVLAAGVGLAALFRYVIRKCRIAAPLAGGWGQWAGFALFPGSAVGKEVSIRCAAECVDESEYAVGGAVDQLPEFLLFVGAIGCGALL